MRRQFADGDHRAGQQLNESQDLFVSWYRSADHRGSHHRWMGIQDRLDIDRIDVKAGTHDKFLGASDDVEIAVLEASQVARVEPSLAVDRRRGFFRRPIVALHDVWSA